ncbi:MAG: OmpH family outer membrane protein [Desulfobulbaceae bacterium]|nr:OmpH family outer membrane protein [Desulfobulbaceae bacterium]
MATKSSRPVWGRLLNYANNPLTIAGAVLTTLTALLILVFMATELAGGFHNPYVPMLAFVVMPVYFILGLLMIFPATAAAQKIGYVNSDSVFAHYRGAADIRVALFRNPSDGTFWAGRGSAEFEAGNADGRTYTAPASDWYGIVVFNNSPGSPGGRSEVRFVILDQFWRISHLYPPFSRTYRVSTVGQWGTSYCPCIMGWVVAFCRCLDRCNRCQ